MKEDVITLEDLYKAREILNRTEVPKPLYYVLPNGHILGVGSEELEDFIKGGCMGYHKIIKFEPECRSGSTVITSDKFAEELVSCDSLHIENKLSKVKDVLEELITILIDSETIDADDFTYNSIGMIDEEFFE